MSTHTTRTRLKGKAIITKKINKLSCTLAEAEPLQNGKVKGKGKRRFV